MPFSDILGHERIVTALRAMLATERVPHAMLFAGPRGVGKYMLARMFAQAANCQRLKDDSCGECDSCRSIARLAEPEALVTQGLTERGESADAATVERVPLILETHPDVWAVVPDPVRLKNPVARPVLHVGQLRAVQHAAYFKPIARRRVFILDGVETMRWDHANIFLKILEEPPETATLILLTTTPYALLSTIRSRCVQFFVSPVQNEQVEYVLRDHSELSSADRKLAVQMAEGSPGDAMALDLAKAVDLRRAVLRTLTTAIEGRSFSELFAQTTQLIKGQGVPFETVLELFYSLLTDLLELSAGCVEPRLRNPNFGKELTSLARQVTPTLVEQAMRGLDELSGRLRRNINKQLGLDAVATSLAADR